MTPDQIRALSDDDFYQLKRDVDADSDRRTRLLQVPEQLTALTRDAVDAGIAPEDVRATVETALTAD